MRLKKKIIAHQRRELFTEAELKAYIDQHYRTHELPKGLSPDIYHDADFPALFDTLTELGFLPKGAVLDIDPSPERSMLKFPEEQYGFRIFELIHGPCSGSVIRSGAMLELSKEDIMCTLLTTKKYNKSPAWHYIVLGFSRKRSGSLMVNIQTKPSDTYPIRWENTGQSPTIH